MTIDEKLAHIESALRKAREGSEGVQPIDFTYAEYDAIEAALEIAAGVCLLLKDRFRS